MDDCFLCDIFSNPLDTLFQILNYAFILMYKKCIASALNHESMTTLCDKAGES